MKDHEKIQQKNLLPNSTLVSLFAQFGFTALTEIQKKASPIILQKKIV
jgi:ATP-dependent helicase Lhr and Lhr-like helicase